MSINLSELKREKKELLVQKRLIEDKLTAIDSAILAYSGNKKVELSGKRIDFDFRGAAKAIFIERANNPLKMTDLLKMLLNKHPELTDKQVRSKFAYARKNVLEKLSYGKYKFKDLDVENSRIDHLTN